MTNTQLIEHYMQVLRTRKQYSGDDNLAITEQEFLEILELINSGDAATLCPDALT